MLVLTLSAHDWLSCNSSDSGILVVDSVEVSSEVVQVVLVLVSYVSKGEAGALFLVDKLSKSRFTFNEAVWDSHLFAEVWQEDHELDWDDVVGNNDQLSLLLLNQSGNVVKTEFNYEWLLGVGVDVLLVSLEFSLFLESLDLLFLGLWDVFGEESEQFLSLVSLDGVSELVDDTWSWKSLLENLLLSIFLFL